MDLDLVRRWYPIGSELVVHLQGGRSARGSLEAIDADSLVLVTDRGPTLLLASAVEQVEAVGGVAAVPSPARPPVPSSVPTPAQAPVVLSSAWESLPREFAVDLDSAVLTAPVFRRDPSVPLGPAAAEVVERELNRASSRHAYGQKVREPERIRQTVGLLAALAAEQRYPPAYHLAALVLLETGTGPAILRQAEKWIAAAAGLGGRYSWDLAVLRMQTGQVSGAAATLGHTLMLSPAESTDDLVLRTYLGLALQTGDTSVAGAVLAAARDAGSPRRRTAVRAGLYLLSRSHPGRAVPLEPMLGLQEPTPQDLHRVLEALEPGWVSAIAPGAVTVPASPPTPDPTPAMNPKDPRLQVLAAQRQLDRGYLDNALKVAETALANHPGHPELLEIAEKARRELAGVPQRVVPSPIRTRQPTLKQPPRYGNSLYAQAQRADTQQKDLDRAERLYRRAIEAGDNAERSVRSLSWLLHRRKRSQEALELLRDPSVVVRETLAHQNMIITIHTDLGHWDEAARLLDEALEEVHPRQTQVGLLKRLIIAHQQSREWESAKRAAQRLLTVDPHNPEFRDIQAELDKVERTGIFNKLDELLADSDWNPEQHRSISPILALHLDSCEYAGVSPTRVQSGQLEEQDVQELDSLSRKLGVRRSGDRAAYNLSAARILRDLNLTEDDRFLKYLRAFAAAMGDFCAAERRAGDVTRAYYAEAVTLGRWDDMGQLKVRQFVLSYLDPRTIPSDGPPKFEKCLTSVLEFSTLRRPVLIGLLGLANGSDSVGKEIVARTYSVKEVRKTLFEELCGYLGQPVRPSTSDAYAGAWQDALRKLRQDMDAQRQPLQLLLNRTDPLDTLAEDQQVLERARDLASTTRLDSDRLSTASGSLGEIRNYLEQSAYLEQERLESKIRTAMRELVTAIEANPTKLSLEYLVPLLKKLDIALAGNFAEVQRAAEPTRLELSLVLSSYVPNAASTIQVQLSVANAHRRSPAVDVTLRVLDNPDNHLPVEAPIQVAQSLRDGQSETCALPLVVTQQAALDQVLTLHYRLEFTVRSGRRIATEPESLSLRLNDSNDWKPIGNPYAEGAPVEDARMFYGRGPLIEILADSLAQNEAKSVVIFGQKRAGKSSVLYHLERALAPPLLAASFSLLELATKLDHSTLLYKMARAFHRRFEDLEDEGRPGLKIPEPRIRDFIDSGAPQIYFDDYMTQVRRQMQQSEVYRDWRLVLLLDEFTMLYAAIERGDLPRGFMKSWKAMLESKLFSSVVVGNDLMPGFLAAFPNEFQVARQERVSYLDLADAEALITEPVPLDGESRYRGDSVHRILELTARSPYYIQLFCNRLIEHMNAERQPLIGPADVDRVATDLVAGDKALLREQFDNLITPGDADVSAISEQAVLGVLNSCLTGRRRDLHLDGRKADETPDGRRVIEDLLRRDVIVREAEDRYRIKVGLFAEWLWHRKA